MKIQGWFVERFGALRNYEITDLREGLTVFCGPNGSGKSTLFAFLRQMLFGGAQAVTGRLYCAGPGGVYTLSQRADNPSQIVVTRPDGTQGDRADLERLFGGAHARSVGSLLAFDINDLQALPSVPAPLRERLFPAGPARGLRSTQRALEVIRARKSALSAGAGRELQRLATAPVELQARIERATRAAVRLCQLLQTQAQARTTLDLRTRAISDLAADHAKYQALVDLSPIWQELTQARRELDTIGAIDEVPLDSEQRLESALTARQAAQRTVAQLVDHERAVRRDSAVALEDAPDRASNTIDTRYGAIVRQKVRLPELDTATATEDLAVWQQRLKEAVDAAREAEREIDATERGIQDLERVRNEISAALNRPEPPGYAVLDEEARLLQNVRTMLAALLSEQTSEKRWQEQIAERGATVRSLEAQVVPIPTSVVCYVAWCTAVAGSVAAVWQYTLQDHLGVIIFAGASLLSVVGATVQRSRRARAFEEDTDRRNQLAHTRSELERSCQSLLNHQERAARRRFDISVDSVRLGLPPVPTDLQLKEREAEIEAQRRQRADWVAAQETLAQTTAALSRHEDLRRQQAQIALAAQTHERQTIQQWNQWKMHAGLAEGANAARGTADDVRPESELLENCRRLRIQIAEWEQHATDWNSRVRATLVGTGDADGASGKVMAAEPEVERSPAVQAARRRLRQCEDAVGELLMQAGVSDEASFRARVAAARRRQGLSQTIRTCEARVGERLRREPAADAIRRELSDGHVEDWRRRVAQSQAELTSIEASRDEVLRRLRQVEIEIAAASTEMVELPVLEAERAGLVAEAEAGVRAARTLVIAGTLLEDASQHLEREAQPAAFRRGSEVLSAITFSRYERLGVADDERDLAVLDSRNGWTPAGQLNRGAAGQLYFSLRAGLAEESAQTGVGLPIIIDDVLDHFDPKRSQAMARQLIDLSRRHQIFVFTRRPETCDLLRNLDSAARIISLQEL